MHYFWYNSPVRFYRNPADLLDYTNPQNNQYFGEHKPYQLEAGELHRFLIPQFDNDLDPDDYTLFIGDTPILSVCRIIDGKLQYITFRCEEQLTGRLELKNKRGEVFYTSNCVQFVNSDNGYGQKFIRVATKHKYNKSLFPYELPNAWFVTTLPAYCIGLIGVQAEINNSRIGANSTLKTNESYIDESVEYQFVANGDGNVLNFIQAAAVNNKFFIDGTQRTSLQKMDADEFLIHGKLDFVNIKNPNGTNVLLDYDDIFSDLSLQVVSLLPKEGFLSKAADYSGEVAVQFNNMVYPTGDGSATLYKDGSVYKSGFSVNGDKLIINSDLLPVGDYHVTVAAGTVRSAQGDINYDIEWDFSLIHEFKKGVTIQFEDGTTADKTGDDQSVTLYPKDFKTDPNDVFETAYWEAWDGSGFTFLRGGITTTGGEKWEEDVVPQTFELKNGLNKFRLTLVTKSGIEVNSNEITYTADIIKTYPTQEYWFSAIHPLDHSGVDKVVYLDGFGNMQEHILQRGGWYGDQYIDAPCELVKASSIISKIGAETCTP